MKIIFAPDKFKGTLSASEVCNILQEAFHSVIPDAELVACPMSDGGEGFTNVMFDACGGQFHRVKVHAPDMKMTEANYLILPDEKTAVMDVASASKLIPWKRHNSAQITATSFGTGELLANILTHEIDKIIIGVGGSGCTDVGTGMGQALGIQFFNSSEIPLRPGKTDLRSIVSISFENFMKKVRNISTIAAVDVDNLLTGENGTANVYASQKGASKIAIEILENGIRSLECVWRYEHLWNGIEEHGFGSGGGIGAALKVYLNASIVSGAEFLLQINHFEKMIANADFIITGEGCTDFQTGFGKVCSKVAQAAHRAKVPVILLSGAITADESFLSKQFDACFSCVNAPQKEDTTIYDAKNKLFFTATQLANVIRMRNH